MATRNLPESDPRFPFVMLKEIYEQPSAIVETLDRHLDADGRIKLDRDPFAAGEVKALRRVRIIASGASRHAGIAGRVMIEEFAGLPVSIEIASEYCYRKPIKEENELAVVITQSGETADTIAAMRTAREAGLKALAVTNVEGSAIVREADGALLTNAGKEIAIPATKSFTTALTVLYLLALYLGEARGTLTADEVKKHVDELRDVAQRMESSLEAADAQSLSVARAYQRDHSFLILGRAAHLSIAMEGALKFKEVCYIHAEGYGAGELRHGPMALVSETTPLIVIATVDKRDAESVLRYEKTVALVEELRPRSERVIVIVNENDPWAKTFKAENVLTVPSAPELLLPLLEVVVLQLLSYHVAVLNGLDVDHPRNLVKSVQQN